MLSCLSFKRGRLCQSSQIRKTEVAERLYLAWVKKRAPGEVRIGWGPAEPLCNPTGSRSCCSGGDVVVATQTGSEWRPSAATVSDDSKLGSKLVPCYPLQPAA